ncbi:dynamin family protein [Marinimicrobium sp. ABcell2]|uniref:dynamin family protein n=1 Tax=Marinimicrobium sp. ABcell2 TaxID=3069751 RepID=UPI0027B62374|nr:dynamin family protein [Marinimicrobium sp. ABcell2]MDQ2076587.1 dynamin family protein [Marinimicrobium sp. ABcell2]
MDIQALHRQMAAYDRWKQGLEQRLTHFDQWIQNHGLVSKEVRQCLEGARKLLRGDGFTIACVGEFSRGKTELINALLVGESKTRILPSQPGRTTMCPTEIYCDAQRSNCVRLLPIETRRSAASLESFRRIPQKWVTLRFDPTDADATRKAIAQVSANRWVTPEEAEQLGFSHTEMGERDHQGRVAIPNWRHAMISLDHPLLRQGLRIIDTPGLNALGNEPELTLKILPQAQVILFLLAADSGVSASDMSIWRDHIQSLEELRGTAVLALLNKVDSLWDDLQPPEHTDAAVARVCELTARQLNLELAQVLPLSAKQALLGRVQDRPQQLARSGFPRLEQALAESIERNRQALAGHRLIVDSQAMILDLYKSLERRLKESKRELELVRTSDQEDNGALLQELRDTIRHNHRHYHKQALSLRTSQVLLEKQRPGLMSPMAPERLEQLIGDTRTQLAGSWTSMGLARAISGFFDALDSQVHHLDREVERANQVLASIYQRPEHGADQSALLEQHLLNLEPQHRKLRQLHRQADQFRASLNNLLSLKGVLIQRFVSTLVQEARVVWSEYSTAIEDWLSQALAPLFHHNQYQKQMLEHHMLRLTRIRSQNQSHAEQMQALRNNIQQLQLAWDEIQPLYRDLNGAGGSPAQGTSAQVVSLANVRRALVNL